MVAMNRLFIFLLLLFSLPIPLSAQTATNNVPRATISAVLAAPTNDPLIQIMMQQPSIDTESPVVITAEFDPPAVPLDERATYRLVITAMNGGIQLPENLPSPPGLELKSATHAEHYSSANNKLFPRTTFLYHARAQTNGTYVMPGFVLSVYGKPYTTPPAQVSFLPTSSVAGSAPLRLKIEFPPGDLYVGQAIPLRLILMEQSPGVLHGFFNPKVVSDAFLPDPTPVRYSRTVVDDGGKPRAAFVNEIAISPIKEGHHTVLVHAQVAAASANAAQSGAIPFYNPLIDSNPIQVQIKPLPAEGRLPGFSGAIGDFQLDPPQLSTNVIRAGEPLVLTVSVRGEGNFSRLMPPPVPQSSAWQVFPPMTEPVLQVQGFLQGGKGFAFTLIPLNDQVQHTPSIPFSYFQPRTKTYVDLTIPPIKITVKPAPGPVAATPSSTTAPSASPPEPEIENRENPLSLTALAEHPGHDYSSLKALQQQTWFHLLQLLPASLLTGLWLRARYQHHQKAHPELAVRRRARRALRRHMRSLRRASRRRDGPAFATAATNALREVCAPQISAHPSALTSQDVLRILPKDADLPENTAAILHLFSASDHRRFHPQPPPIDSLCALESDTERIIRVLKRQLSHS